MILAGIFPAVAEAKTIQAVVIVKQMEIRDSDGNVLGTLKKGTEVVVHGTKNGIARITFQGKKGYAQLSDLQKIEDAPTTVPAPAAPTKPSPTGRRATVIKDGAKVYHKPSKSAKVIGTLNAGNTVQILETRNPWAYIRKDGDTAYILSENLSTDANHQPSVPVATKPPASPTSLPSVPEKYPTISQGQRGAHVMKLQKQLESLGYFDGNPAGNYLALTTSAIRLFQSEAGIPVNGIADNLTQTALYSKKAPKSPILKKSFSKGDRGEDVKRIQQRLSTKGYYNGNIDGVYGENLAAAIAAYQGVNGGEKTGVCDNQTIRHLFSSKAAEKPANVTVPTPEVTPKPTPTPTPTKTASPANPPSGGNSAPSEPAAPSSSKAETVIVAAMAQMGKPYILGATGMSSFDCSGLTLYAFGQAGITLPRTAHLQGYNAGEKVTKSQLKRGDIVCFSTTSSASLSNHVGIYLGNNQFIHASSGQRKVVISTITGFYLTAFSWGRRVL